MTCSKIQNMLQYIKGIKMNERIRELVKQATTIEEHKWGVSYDNFNKEKFAELIVRECAGVELYWLSEQDRKAVAEKIKEHFGVEE